MQGNAPRSRDYRESKRLYYGSPGGEISPQGQVLGVIEWSHMSMRRSMATRKCCPTSTSSLSTLSLRRTLTRTSPSRRLSWICTLAIQESRCIATMVLGRSACHIIQRHTGSPRHRYGENLVSLGLSCSRNT